MKKITLFLALLFAVLAPIACANKAAIARKLASDAYRLAPGTDTLIMGDSHGETSLDPALLPGSANLSASGESIFYTFYKLKHLIGRNPGVVRKVILAFSYHNISKKYQEEYLFEDVKSAYSFARYYIYLDYPAKKKLFDSSNFIIYTLKNDFGVPLMEYKESATLRFLCSNQSAKIDELGGFKASEVATLDPRKVNQKIKSYFFTESGYAGYSPIMVESVERIAELCAENGIKLYLYNAPLHASYRRQVPAGACDDYARVLQSLKQRHPEVVVLDLSQTPLLNDDDFQDGDHVNRAGAKLTSVALSSRIHCLRDHP